MKNTTPWGMQIAVRYDKVHPARSVDVAEAVGRAVVSLLASPLAQPGGPWYADVQRWRQGGRIRKLVRRARGARWDEVQELDGVTVTQDGPSGWGQAAARAFVPAPVRPLAPALAKTQVEGTNFPDGSSVPPAPSEASRDPEVARSMSLTPYSLSTRALVTVEVTPLHEMTSGKMAAQVAHAAQLAYESRRMPARVRRAWEADGFRIYVDTPTVQEWRQQSRPVTVTDAGLTELGGPTQTTRAFW